MSTVLRNYVKPSTMMLCPESPCGVLKSGQLALQIKAWSGCLNNWDMHASTHTHTRTHTSGKLLCKTVVFKTLKSLTVTQLHLWIKNRMNINARTHTKNIQWRCGLIFDQMSARDEFIGFLFMLLCQGIFALHRKWGTFTHNHKNTDILYGSIARQDALIHTIHTPKEALSQHTHYWLSVRNIILCFCCPSLRSC